VVRRWREGGQKVGRRWAGGGLEVGWTPDELKAGFRVKGFIGFRV
jgi:hypothetical protein